jgi:CRISPR-associated protein Csb2
LINSDWTPVPPYSATGQVRYRRDSDPAPHPNAVFKLVDENDDTVAYSHSKLVHIAGMVKHLAIERMKRYPPPRSELRGRSAEQWVEHYVAGHQSLEGKAANAPHTQFSYIPLQSIGNPNTDPGIRRVMIVAPLGDDAWLEHLARRLDGQSLKPLPNTTLPPGTRLERIDDHRKDGVRDGYLRASVTWASVTPVILPGHDDHKPNKTRSLICKALQQSGVEQPCEFEWSAFSQFRKMLPAHKYRKDPNDPSKKILINYVRPNHLLDLSAVHLTIRFGQRENPNAEKSRRVPATIPIPGPLAIGAGRHCGFGLMAGID